jgi:outer membrane assembly lipoprotein YfiO
MIRRLRWAARRRARWSRWATAALAGLLAGCAAGTLPPVSSDADRLNLARAYRERGDCAQAILLLQSYVSVAAGSADVDEAIYLLGDCYVQTKQYALGESELERLLRDYPESDSAAAAAFRLGEAYWGQARGPDFDQEQTLKALGQWQDYLRVHPGHWQNESARARIAQARGRLAEKAYRNGMLYIKLGLPGPARAYFERVEQEFGDTPVAADAAYGLALSSLRQGDERSARVQLERVQTEYPGSAAAQRAQRELARLQRERPRGKS